MMRLWPLMALLSMPVPAAAAIGCDGYFYFEEGRRIESVAVDHKGGSKGRKLMTISAVSREGNAIGATITTDAFDDKGRLVGSGPAKARCENGDLLLDLTAGLPTQKDPLRQRSPSFLRFPATMRVGQLLDARIDFDLEGVAKGRAITVNFSMADRRVAGEAAVDTPIGRRQSFLITSILNIRFKVLGIAIPMRIDLTEYFVPGLGVVRSETMQKGKVVERSAIRFLTER